MTGADGWPASGWPAWATPEHVLAVYGTLRPGESNHDVVADLRGRWLTGTVRGRLGVKRSGTYHGYPAVRLDQPGRVPVAVLVSPELPAHWWRLDEFEGPEYRRVVAEVRLAPDSGPGVAVCRANLYEVLTG